MAVRNLDNIPLGEASPVISFRADYKTREILTMVFKAGMPKSQFIRIAILEFYESILKESKTIEEKSKEIKEKAIEEMKNK